MFKNIEDIASLRKRTKKLRKNTQVLNQGTLDIAASKKRYGRSGEKIYALNCAMLDIYSWFDEFDYTLLIEDPKERRRERDKLEGQWRRELWRRNACMRKLRQGSI
jgi:hypothetical protein